MGVCLIDCSACPGHRGGGGGGPADAQHICRCKKCGFSSFFRSTKPGSPKSGKPEQEDGVGEIFKSPL
jgi:hypothetical protein